jgi:hypothetical protein
MSTNTPTRAARPRICPTCKTAAVTRRAGSYSLKTECGCTAGLICGSPGAAILSWERAERNKREPVGERRKRARKP